MAFIVQSVTKYGRENLDSARDRIEAEALTEEYQLILGPSARVTYREAKSANRKRRPI
jgi:hypothetical protein